MDRPSEEYYDFTAMYLRCLQDLRAEEEGHRRRLSNRAQERDGSWNVSSLFRTETTVRTGGIVQPEINQPGPSNRLPGVNMNPQETAASFSRQQEGFVQNQASPSVFRLGEWNRNSTLYPNISGQMDRNSRNDGNGGGPENLQLNLSNRFARDNLVSAETFQRTQPPGASLDQEIQHSPFRLPCQSQEQHSQQTEGTWRTMEPNLQNTPISRTHLSWNLLRSQTIRVAQSSLTIHHLTPDNPESPNLQTPARRQRTSRKTTQPKVPRGSRQKALASQQNVEPSSSTNLQMEVQGEILKQENQEEQIQNSDADNLQEHSGSPGVAGTPTQRQHPSWENWDRSGQQASQQRPSTSTSWENADLPKTSEKISVPTTTWGNQNSQNYLQKVHTPSTTWENQDLQNSPQKIPAPILSWGSQNSQNYTQKKQTQNTSVNVQGSQNLLHKMRAPSSSSWENPDSETTLQKMQTPSMSLENQETHNSLRKVRTPRISWENQESQNSLQKMHAPSASLENQNSQSPLQKTHASSVSLKSQDSQTPLQKTHASSVSLKSQDSQSSLQRIRAPSRSWINQNMQNSLQKIHAPSTSWEKTGSQNSTQKARTTGRSVNQVDSQNSQQKVHHTCMSEDQSLPAQRSHSQVPGMSLQKHQSSCVEQLATSSTNNGTKDAPENNPTCLACQRAKLPPGCIVLRLKPPSAAAIAKRALNEKCGVPTVTVSFDAPEEVHRYHENIEIRAAERHTVALPLDIEEDSLPDISSDTVIEVATCESPTEQVSDCPRHEDCHIPITFESGIQQMLIPSANSTLHLSSLDEFSQLSSSQCPETAKQTKKKKKSNDGNYTGAVAQPSSSQCPDLPKRPKKKKKNNDGNYTGKQ